MMRIYVSFVVFCLGILQAMAYESGLQAKSFSRYWQVESESPDYRVTFWGDTCELISPKGLTLWRKEKMKAGMTVEYDACVVVETGEDRLSDMNCFWLASDPQAKDIWARAKWRSGIFLRCYTLQMYYLGYGGNYNKTTRFRRYDGNEAGVEDATKRPAILKEYTDADHLLKANHWYHVKIESKMGHTRFFIDGECIECVLMRHDYGTSLCISSQVGCRMGCKFCASTLAGKVRDLYPSEMLGQIIAAGNDSGERIDKLVLMGIGEPLDNYENVVNRRAREYHLRYSLLSSSPLVYQANHARNDYRRRYSRDYRAHYCSVEQRYAEQPWSKQHHSDYFKTRRYKTH